MVIMVASDAQRLSAELELTAMTGRQPELPASIWFSAQAYSQLHNFQWRSRYRL